MLYGMSERCGLDRQPSTCCRCRQNVATEMLDGAAGRERLPREAPRHSLNAATAD